MEFPGCSYRSVASFSSPCSYMSTPAHGKRVTVHSDGLIFINCLWLQEPDFAGRGKIHIKKEEQRNSHKLFLFFFVRITFCRDYFFLQPLPHFLPQAIVIFGYDLKLLSFFATSWSFHVLKLSLLPKKFNHISLFFTLLDQSHRILCFVMDLSWVQSECLIMLSLSIPYTPIRYSTRSVSLINWWILKSPYHTTSIHKNAVFTFSTPHQDPFPACHNISLGSHILPHSPFSQITKCTEAWAGDSDRYLMLLLYVHPAVWWITIPIHLFFQALFLVVDTLSLNGYMLYWVINKNFFYCWWVQWFIRSLVSHHLISSQQELM